jgi:hypothetical protein
MENELRVGDQYKYLGKYPEIWEVLKTSRKYSWVKCIDPGGNTNYSVGFKEKWVSEYLTNMGYFELYQNKSNNFKLIYDILNDAN